MNESGLNIGDDDHVILRSCTVRKEKYIILVNPSGYHFVSSDWVKEHLISCNDSGEDSEGLKTTEWAYDEFDSFTHQITGTIELSPEAQTIIRNYCRNTDTSYWDVVHEFKKLQSILQPKEPIDTASLNSLFDQTNYKLKTVWDEERTHINPYSKKQKKMIYGGKRQNKGRTSAQYFTLRSTRKQNTSSVR